jgi:protein phosphatase
MRLDISARTIVGSKEPQQDSWRVFARGQDVSSRAARTATTGDGTLVIVADGIGGYAGGEIASKLACDAFGKTFFEAGGSVDERTMDDRVVGDCLKRALGAANAAIAAEKQRSPDLQDMGCTLIGVYFYRDNMTFVSVGDSLLLRSRDQEIHRVNLDHSYFEYLDRQVLGSDDPQKWSLAVHDTRRRASLTLAVAGGELTSAEFGHEPQIATRKLLADDVIIVASDGIETLDLVQLQNFMLRLRPSGAPGIADSLIRAVDGIGKTRSYQDNTTIVVVAASEGAGMTRVARPAVQVTEAEPAGRGWTPARTLSFLPAFSWKRAAAVGSIFVIVMLLLGIVFRSDSREPPADGKAPKSIGVPGPKDRHSEAKDPKHPANSVTSAPGDPKPDAGRQPETGQQAALGRTPETAPNVPTEAAPPAQNDSTAAVSDAPAKPERLVQGQMRTSLPDVRFRGQPRSAKRGLNSGECTNACLDDDSCAAFTWHADNRCELFSVVGKFAPEAGALSGWDKVR